MVILAGALSANSVPYNANASPEQSPYHVSPSHPELRAAGGAHSSPHGRDTSNTRGRKQGQLNGPSTLQPLTQSGRALSPRTPRNNGDAAPRAPAGALERRPSATYGHHRQASIVHGVSHHSRNPSFTNSSLNHRSPQPVAINVPLAGVGFEASSLNTSIVDSSDIHFNGSSSSTFNGSLSSYASTSTLGNRDLREMSDTAENSITQKRIDRKQSGKTRHDHSRSQSKHQNQPEQTSVGEYALHHLFHSVSRPK